MIKIYICDDNLLELEKTTHIVRQWAVESGIKVELSSFDNGDAMLINHRNRPADIILLDIMMPLLDGMETARELRKSDSTVKIVFLTSSTEFAIESYDVKASGYMLKPVDTVKINNILNEIAASISKEPENIVMKTVLGYQKIYIEKIECIEAQNRRVVITLNDGSIVEGNETFSNVSGHFAEKEGFFKCHRSYIVAIDNVDKFNSAEIITKCGKRIPIARGYGKLFKDAYFAYMFKKGKG